MARSGGRGKSRGSGKRRGKNGGPGYNPNRSGDGKFGEGKSTKVPAAKAKVLKYKARQAKLRSKIKATKIAAKSASPEEKMKLKNQHSKLMAKYRKTKEKLKAAKEARKIEKKGEREELKKTKEQKKVKTKAETTKAEHEAKKAEHEVKKTEHETKKAELELKKAEHEVKKIEHEAKKAENEALRDARHKRIWAEQELASQYADGDDDDDDASSVGRQKAERDMDRESAMTHDQLRSELSKTQNELRGDIGNKHRGVLEAKAEHIQAQLALRKMNDENKSGDPVAEFKEARRIGVEVGNHNGRSYIKFEGEYLGSVDKMEDGTFRAEVSGYKSGRFGTQQEANDQFARWTHEEFSRRNSLIDRNATVDDLKKASNNLDGVKMRNIARGLIEKEGMIPRDALLRDHDIVKDVKWDQELPGAIAFHRNSGPERGMIGIVMKDHKDLASTILHEELHGAMLGATYFRKEHTQVFEEVVVETVTRSIIHGRIPTGIKGPYQREINKVRDLLMKHTDAKTDNDADTMIVAIGKKTMGKNRRSGSGDRGFIEEIISVVKPKDRSAFVKDAENIYFAS